MLDALCQLLTKHHHLPDPTRRQAMLTAHSQPHDAAQQHQNAGQSQAADGGQQQAQPTATSTMPGAANANMNVGQMTMAAGTMRLRDEPAPINPQSGSGTSTRATRKRKEPPEAQQNQPQTQTAPGNAQGIAGPPQPLHHAGNMHALVHQQLPAMHLPHPHMYGQPGMQDYTPGGMPIQNAPQQPTNGQPGSQGQNAGSPGSTGAGGQRILSATKRAEQNRKAQRAFRERRDQ